jgi:ABC-2 type transport system ATP-binding protein
MLATSVVVERPTLDQVVVHLGGRPAPPPPVDTPRPARGLAALRGRA